jgi:hypothetical protein
MLLWSTAGANPKTSNVPHFFQRRKSKKNIFRTKLFAPLPNEGIIQNDFFLIQKQFRLISSNFFPPHFPPFFEHFFSLNPTEFIKGNLQTEVVATKVDDFPRKMYITVLARSCQICKLQRKWHKECFYHIGNVLDWIIFKTHCSKEWFPLLSKSTFYVFEFL